jgi:hypothetical protein
VAIIDPAGNFTVQPNANSYSYRQHDECSERYPRALPVVLLPRISAKRVSVSRGEVNRRQESGYQPQHTEEREDAKPKETSEESLDVHHALLS